METLQQEKIKTFSILGLKAICSHNRDILFSFNHKTRQEISNILKSKLDENHIIQIPKFIYNDDNYILGRKKK
jgi:hypothetical protein